MIETFAIYFGYIIIVLVVKVYNNYKLLVLSMQLSADAVLLETGPR